MKANRLFPVRPLWVILMWLVLTVVALGIGTAGHGARLPKHSTTAVSATPDRIEVYPAEVKLQSHRDYRQLVVTGYFHGEARDLTHEAVYRNSNEQVAHLHAGEVTAAGDGRARIDILAGGRSLSVPITVTNFIRPDPIRFKLETLAVLTKQGCATGSCHGSPHGKGGFSLSLFGYAPNIDRISLTRDGFNRRIDIQEPADSLILKKPLLEIPHVGGKRLHKTDASYSI